MVIYIIIILPVRHDDGDVGRVPPVPVQLVKDVLSHDPQPARCVGAVVLPGQGGNGGQQLRPLRELVKSHVELGLRTVRHNTHLKKGKCVIRPVIMSIVSSKNAGHWW